MSKLKHRIFGYLLPEKAREGYYGNILGFSFINELSVFGGYRQPKEKEQ
jgi:hypothetical protein